MSAEAPLGTLIVEAGASVEWLMENLDDAMVGVAAGRHRVVILSRRGEEVPQYPVPDPVVPEDLITNDHGIVEWLDGDSS